MHLIIIIIIMVEIPDPDFAADMVL